MIVGPLLQDYNARTYVAYTLSQALNTTLTAEEVLAVSAMEAVGVALAMQKFSAIPGNPKVRYVAPMACMHPNLKYFVGCNKSRQSNYITPCVEWYSKF